MSDVNWLDPLAADVRFGYLSRDAFAPRRLHPQVVVNGPGESVLRVVREELAACESFLFSVAFVTPRALALLKQELVDFEGRGRIVTSDYLAFNSPAAFAELLNLEKIGIEVRRHQAKAFHPKGYIFQHSDAVTAMVGSSNLTENALVSNYEWNLKVTAATGSDLARQFADLIGQQLDESVDLTPAWVADYADGYVAPPRPTRVATADAGATAAGETIVANPMQREALAAIADVRARGERRALVISATGTGKTILSALDVRAVDPRRLLFVVHREQVLDRTIAEYKRVLGGADHDYGKLTGTSRQTGARYLFATIQTLSQPWVLGTFDPMDFDYLVMDEAHRAGAAGHQRVLDHFRPAFALGMTATPERTDGLDVFRLFDYNVPYEIRLDRALEDDMLCPFHYYGVTDVVGTDGATVSDGAQLSVLISPERVDHLLWALEVYGQASVDPCGLIFCSRTDEAHALSDALNQRSMRGRPLRTLAVTGEDSISEREEAVARLERGDLDYLLSVDVFNEGVDIPSINQVVMLRQTQSQIVFVQQLGRGLRKAPGKDFVVVLDLIGNYTTNYLIPMALFGDESLNKESLKKHLIAAEEAGVLPGLASVRFDRIAQRRVLSAIATARLDSMQNLKKSIATMRNRVGRIPALADFLRFESTDPVLLATKRRSYPELVEHLFAVPSGLTAREAAFIELASNEVLTAKRAHEFVLLRTLLAGRALTDTEVADAFTSAGLPADHRHVTSAIETLTLAQHAKVDQTRYGTGLAVREDGTVRLAPSALESYVRSPRFAAALDDIVDTGAQLVARRYAAGDPFAPGWQYSRKEVTRLLCWPRRWTSTLYGYRVDRPSRACAIFVTLHKSRDVAASTAYADALLDPTTLLWYSRSRRTLASGEVRAIVDNDVHLHVFVKKDDAEGADFYYLGRATAQGAVQTTMPDGHGDPLDVVRMTLHFAEPVDSALFDYFHPVLTDT